MRTLWDRFRRRRPWWWTAMVPAAVLMLAGCNDGSPSCLHSHSEVYSRECMAFDQSNHCTRWQEDSQEVCDAWSTPPAEDRP